MYMSLLSCLSVFLATVITPCLSRITEVEFRDDSRPSVALARPFAFADAGPDAEAVIVMSIADAAVTWRADVPGESQDLECFRLCLVSKDDYQKRMDARGVDSICAVDPDLPPWWQVVPDWAVIFLTFDDATYYDHNMNKVISPLVTGTVHATYDVGVWWTPYFINCCPDLATVSFETEVELSTEVNGNSIYLPLDKVELPTLYRVRFFHPSNAHVVRSLPMLPLFRRSVSSYTITSDPWSYSIIVYNPANVV